MTGGTEEKNPTPHLSGSRKRGHVLFPVFLGVAILLPPLGIALGLVILTSSDDEPYSGNRSSRGKTLMAVGGVALVLQIVLAAIFLVPRALKYIDEQLSNSRYPGNPLSSINPSGYKTPQQMTHEQTLRMVLDSHSDQNVIRGIYEKSREALEAGSKEPFDRYIVACALAYTEFGDEIIEDDDERREKVAKLIREGLSLDGWNVEEEETLDTIMLTPLMHTQLEEDDIKGIYETYDRLLAVDKTRIDGFVVYITHQWAYNSLFEYWQIRDPHKSLDLALETIRNAPWRSSDSPLGYFLFGRYGGLDNVFLLAKRLGRTDEFFTMVEEFIDTALHKLTLEQDLAQLYLLAGQYYGDDGRWEDALTILTMAAEILPDAPETIYSKAVAQLESGRRTEAADTVFNVTLGGRPLLSIDDFRYLFADYPAEGAEYLVGRLVDNPQNVDHLNNLAILAHNAGKDDLASISAELITYMESGFSLVTPDVISYLSQGDIKSARKTCSDITIDIGPSTVNTYVTAFIHSQDASPEEAALLTRAALEHGPYERDADFPLFETYFSSMQEMGKTGEAFIFLRKLIDDNPNDLFPRYFLARKLREAGRLEDAFRTLDEVQIFFASPGQNRARERPSGHFDRSSDWIIKLNDVQISDIYREKALIYRAWDDVENYDHHIFLTHVYGYDFESELLVAKYVINEGDLKEAGRMLDNLTFYPEADDKGSPEYHALMETYAELEAAGWVRERDFEPFTIPPNT